MRPSRIRTTPARLVAACMAAAWLTTACAPTGNVPEAAEPGADLPLGEPVAAFSEAVLRARQLAPDFDPGTLVPRLPTDPNVCVLRLALFEDVVVDVQVTGVTQSAAATIVRGEIMGEVDSSVMLSITHGASANAAYMAGTLRTASRFYSIVPRDGATVVVEWNEAAALPDADPIVPVLPTMPSPRSAVVSEHDGEPPVIDLMVVATSAAVDGAGGTDAMRALIELALAETNQGLADSGVSGRFALAGTLETAYDETEFNFNEALTRLATPGDGYMDEVPGARDEMGADQVVLLVESVTRFAGTGFQMTAGNAGGFAPLAYSVVSRDYAAGYYTFAHELGHNLGAQHDPEHANEGYRDDARGHQVPEAGYRTLMAYSCDDADCRRVARWSSPSSFYSGAATGREGVSDNARTLRETMPIAAAFRTRPTIAPPPAAEVLSPEAGAVLADAPLRLRWSDVGADAYYVTVGAAPGEATWGRAFVTDGVVTTFEAPPPEGQPVFVRLWSQHAGVWRHTEVRYTAAAPSFEGAAVSLPVPGEALTSTWLWFAWPDVEGALEYRLRVGTNNRPGALYDRTQVGRWALVTGLPIDGGDVRVELSTRGPDGWVERVTHYDGWAAPPHVSAITAPAAGARLGGRSVRVQWTRSEATAHWLVVRDDDGLLLAEPVTGTSANLSDLPLDGRRLYGVLYSQGPDSWTPTVVTWTAADDVR
ncbi:MAG: M12 family metallo-peptidase [Sandaracinaceae bacterium]